MGRNIRNGLTYWQRLNRISKREFYRRGGFANPYLYRITRNGYWVYLQGR